MKYIDADRLRAEIEKKRNEIVAEALDPDASIERVASAKYKKDALSDAISIIDSLQQEQPEVDLNKEIDSCWQGWVSPSNQSSVEGVLPKSEFSMYARHFFDLGLNARKV